MCGIVGIWHRQDPGTADQARLTAAAETLAHRGPDDAGVWTQGPVGFAHRRLSILDLSLAGRQPMATPDGRYRIVFNGEIYNFRELQQKYLHGVRLSSSSDTEVLLHVLAQQGSAVLPHLRGMFAFAFWDAQEEALLLARDPFGKKPLYWAAAHGVFSFASEVKALLHVQPALKAIDRPALAKYFLYEYVPSPASGYQDIRQLSMGHLARVRRDSVELKAWWRPSYRPKTEIVDEEHTQREFDRHLKHAVERRMIADVPVGLLLSGGLDSTTIGWYMRQCTTSPLHSFSVSFGEKSFDESSYARLAARALQTVHHELRFDVAAFQKAVSVTAAGMDIPFGDASLLPTYAISKLARQEITVALDGDGSDELLGGYGTFQAAAVADRLPRLPHAVVSGLRGALNLLPTSYGNFSFDFKLKSFVEGLAYGRAARNQIWLGSFGPRDLQELLVPAWRSECAQVLEDVAAIVEATRALATFDAISWLTVHHYLQNDILVKLDRATMLTSLEARTPFLDLDFAEFVMHLPVHLKQNKYMLRRVMRGRIPDAIIDRSKRGFGIPLGFWLRGPLYGWAREVLAPRKLRQQGVLAPQVVERLLREHKSGKADWRKKLWTLLAWQLWYDRWMA
ncbi:MAG TPA: asparagine synthase (glutamine-hydrolyzing) [Candidatus Andersenbacteria bacterium]|nr:asparagine synthase (glutamine-hydrolyzing) [Candidatus Andersenbacteria bacterium]